MKIIKEPCVLIEPVTHNMYFETKKIDEVLKMFNGKFKNIISNISIRQTFYQDDVPQTIISFDSRIREKEMFYTIRKSLAGENTNNLIKALELKIENLDGDFVVFTSFFLFVFSFIPLIYSCFYTYQVLININTFIGIKLVAVISTVGINIIIFIIAHLISYFLFESINYYRVNGFK